MKTGIQLIAEERQRQTEQEGYSAEHDDQHTKHELAKAAICYAMPPKLRPVLGARGFWPFELETYKPQNRIRDLQRAGALIAAELDRLLRAEERRERDTIL